MTVQPAWPPSGTHATRFQDLSDVDFTSFSDQEVALYDATANKLNGVAQGTLAVQGRHRGPWQATTAYRANDLVTNAGTLYRANADFTSGGSFNGANWTAVFSTGGVASPVVLQSNASGEVPLKVKARAAGQAANLLEAYDTTGAVVASIDRTGVANVATVQSHRIEMHGTSVGAVSTAEPLINFYNQADANPDQLKWQIGLDVANSVNDDLVLAVRALSDGSGGVQDVLYLRDYGTSAAPAVAFGFGDTPPPNSFRASFRSPDNSAWGNIILRQGQSATGDFIRCQDSAGNQLFGMKADGSLRGTDWRAGITQGLLITDVGNDASRVLSVVGRSTQTADIVTITTNPGASGAHFQRDVTEVKFALKRTSDGSNAVVFRNNTTLGLLTSKQAADDLLLLQFAASPTGSALNVLNSTGASLVRLDASGNIVPGSAGIKIAANNAQKIAFYGAAPIVQPATAGTTTGFTAGAGTAVDSAATFTGNTGATAYTIGDVVRHLKLLGLIAA